MEKCFEGAIGYASEMNFDRSQPRIIDVINTQAHGLGCFHDALQGQPNRIVVPKVAGEIFQNEVVGIRTGQMKVYGHMAPGDGFAFAGMLSIQESDILLMGLRFRLGKRVTGVAPDKQKGVEVWPGRNTTVPVERIMIAYCDSLFGIDVAAWSFGTSNGVPPKYITVYRCAGGLGLRNAGHSKGAHSMCATSNASGANFVDYIQSLFSECNHRMPNLHMGEGGRGNIINCVTTNSEHGSNAISLSGDINVIGCSFGNIKGRIVIDVQEGSRVYLADCRLDGRPATWEDLCGTGKDHLRTFDVHPMHPSLEEEGAILSAEEAYDVVLDFAGAMPRDRIIADLVERARNLSGSVIDDEAEVGYPNTFSGLLTLDSDGDGMPDAYELANGTNPTAYDSLVIGADGRLNIERYSDSLLGDPDPVDPVPPVVKITRPFNGQAVRGKVKITADVSDNVGVKKVNFLIAGQPVGVDLTSPYEYSWDTAGVPRGPVTVTVQAFDAAGNSAEDTVTVRVNEPFNNQ